MQPHHNFDLQAHNTLSIPARAEFFYEATDLASLRLALAWANTRQLPVTLLGGGSNVICPSHISGLVLSPALQGRHLRREQDQTVWVELAAGENWHQAVCWTLDQQLYGLENLALIPGTCGAAPIQNIGAYGLELGDRLHEVTALNRHTNQLETFSREQCDLGYRDSIFKQALASSHIITHISLQLSRQPQSLTHYPALRSALGADVASPEAVFTAVCELRRSKLPDPATLPNCGSFFKNPLVTADDLHTLQMRHPQIPSYPASGERYKLAAAWLIEQAGWKGRDIAGVRVHAQQALVLTNPNRLGAEAILHAATTVQRSVKKEFGIALEIEPQILGNAPTANHG